jgi:hypothetical protein
VARLRDRQKAEGEDDAGHWSRFLVVVASSVAMLFLAGCESHFTVHLPKNAIVELTQYSVDQYTIDLNYYKAATTPGKGGQTQNSSLSLLSFSHWAGVFLIARIHAKARSSAEWASFGHSPAGKPEASEVLQ